MTVHSEHPFRSTEREPARQFRARLGGRVCLWCTATSGLTVSSMIVVGGDPWRVVAPLSPDADLTDDLLAGGRACISLLSSGDEFLAEAFAGLAPAPGGPFRLAGFEPNDWGRRLATADSWAGIELESMTQLGWSQLAVGILREIVVGPDIAPLHHERGRYQARPPTQTALS